MIAFFFDGGVTEPDPNATNTASFHPAMPSPWAYRQYQAAFIVGGMVSVKLHLDRTSALSFGSISDQYDRYRPGPPQSFIDDLMALSPVDALDIACGTGKVAVELVRNGVQTLGVEIDERMVEIARGYDIPVEVAAFESWDAAGRRFDLITCGDAWHWIDPVRGVEKAASVLRPGGTLALSWSYQLFNDDVAAAFQRIYDEHAPQATTHSYRPHQALTEPFIPTSAFGPVETRDYRWDATVSASQWAGLVATFSDHRALTRWQLTSIQTALSAAIEDLGGTVTVTRGVHAALTRRQ